MEPAFVSEVTQEHPEEPYPKTDSDDRNDGTPLAAYLFQFALLLLLPFALYPAACNSPFVANSATQYSFLVLVLVIDGLIATLITYIFEVVFERVQHFCRALLLLGAFGLGVTALATWFGQFKEGRVDELGVWVLVFACISGTVSFYEAFLRRSDRSHREHWRWTFIFIDGPLVVTCAAVVLFKYAYYSQGTEAYVKYLVTHLAMPRDRPPDWMFRQGALAEALRESFWAGFTIGVIGTQLLITQFVSICYGMSSVTFPGSSAVFGDAVRGIASVAGAIRRFAYSAWGRITRSRARSGTDGGAGGGG